MKKINYICVILIIICIPMIIITFSTNITIRYPEVCAYYLNDSQVLDYTDIDLTGNELSSQLGKFFMSFDDNAQIVQDTGYTKDPVFSDKEYQLLMDIRSNINIMAVAGIACFMFLIVSYMILLKNGEKDTLWYYGRMSTYIAFGVSIVYNVLWALPSVRLWIYDHITNVVLTKDSNLYIIASKGDWSTIFVVAQSAISIILLLLIIYVTRCLTKSRTIFTR